MEFETKLEEDKHKDQAFLLQFEGNIWNIEELFGIKNDTISIMFKTGLFGIIDALKDLRLSSREINKFYIHGHAEDYDDPKQFTKGIIKIVCGMQKDEIKNQYGRYFCDETIERIYKPNINTCMLMSFCYSHDDMYEFIPNGDDLIRRFSIKYSGRRDIFSSYSTLDEFQKIDGKLFRAVHYLVRQGYAFPNIEYLINDQIKDISFKHISNEKTFILNKDFAREISDNLLSLVCFLKRRNYKFLNPEYMFDSQHNNIFITDSNGQTFLLNRTYLESDVNKYTKIIENLNSNKLIVSDIISLCDKRIRKIELKYIGNKSTEHTLFINREKLETISQHQLNIINKAYKQGLLFQDSDNLFDESQEMLKVVDNNCNEHFIVREQFNNMLEMIIKCKENNFSINQSQLFNINQIDVELLDSEGRKVVIKRDSILQMMDIISMLTQNDYSLRDYNSLFNEVQSYIEVYDKQNQKRILSRKQIKKIIRVQKLSYKEKKELSDNEKDLLFMLDHYSTKEQLFAWLPYTTKKWIPSSAIICKIQPENSYEYFHNNNHARLKILKDVFHPCNYEEMEGIVSLGYILGLFDSKESTSKKAVNFIIDYFLKKGITADEIHSTYGSINLNAGYNKQFADFFMYHYALDSNCFIEPDLGTNMVGELYERFDEILKVRPEKKVKTRTINKLLTPKDAMAAITTINIDQEMLGEKINDEHYILLFELLIKFGATKKELKWAMNLYEQALAIDEQKVRIPYIDDFQPSSMRFNSHFKRDPHVFLSGKKTNCCSRYGGHAEDRLTHVITDLNWRYVTFTSLNTSFFDGLVWYDEEEQVVCIDNVEGHFSKHDKNNDKSVAMMADTIIRYADRIYIKMNEINIPCKKVNVGKDPGTESWEIFNYAMQQNLIVDDKNPSNYPKRNGISTDANNQFTITDEKILRYRRNN